MQAVTVDHGKPHCNTVLLCIGTSVSSLYLRIHTGEEERQECLPRAEAGESSQPPQSSTTPHAPGYHECCSLRVIRGPPLQQKFTAKNGHKTLAPLYLPHSRPYVFVEGKDYKGKKNS